MNKMFVSRWKISVLAVGFTVAGLLGLFWAGAQVAPPVPLSLKDVHVPEPTNLHAFIKGDPGTPEAAAAREIAIVLGKALFWDMQVGSDDIMACASCHFNAGADRRTKNQLAPIDGIFGNSAIGGIPGPNDPPFNYGFGPNFEISAQHFPFHRRSEPTAPVDPLDPVNEFANVIMDTNDVLSSQGVRENDDPIDPPDTIFNWKGANQRKVAPRNAPSPINAVFHLDMFWDGRGSFIFNGVNPFGFRDRESTVKRNMGTAEAPDIQDVFVRIPFSAHASQAVGPPLSTLEMTGFIRDFRHLADKLLDPALNPLALQMVHPLDSVLGPYAKASYVLNKQGKQTGRIDNIPGTKNQDGSHLTYRELIEQAFKDEWWNGSETQMAENFALFFGLATQLYQSTLVADDTPFDRFMGANANVRGGGVPIPPNPGALTPQEQLGLDLFQGTDLSGQNPGLINAGCNNCHFLPESSNHVVRLAGLAPPAGVVNDPLDPVNVLTPQTVLELMAMGDGNLAVYDIGFYNLGVRPTEEDIGRAGRAPATMDFGSGLPFSLVELALMKLNNLLPLDVARFVPDQGIVEVEQPDGTIVDVPLLLDELFELAGNRIVTRGAFKVPTLRNQEFQGPYFHNGGDATLRQVVEFYVRGGNFPATNIDHLDADIQPLPEFDVTNPDPALALQAELNIRALVAFLSRGLTDQRVATRAAPFDHPQLFIPEGVTGKTPLLGFDNLEEIKATGAGGAESVPRFLNLDPQSP
jgi:cytochrome c peroxidase